MSYTGCNLHYNNLLIAHLLKFRRPGTLFQAGRDALGVTFNVDLQASWSRRINEDAPLDGLLKWRIKPQIEIGVFGDQRILLPQLGPFASVFELQRQGSKCLAAQAFVYALVTTIL